jgi:hypothetical protein
MQILPNEVCDAAGLDYTLLDGFDHESRVRKLLGMLAAAEPNLMGLDLVRFEEVRACVRACVYVCVCLPLIDPVSTYSLTHTRAYRWPMACTRTC